ncbi:MAG: transglycosylase SLT domain-containing protein [Firmicutes bacterium]|nr:lytic transglycosylase domain-containing protein [Bacillota bacterium]MDD7601364.1 transglycosylase SLT domain-containing protein [Bacillota bacterium]MDY5856327.1 transglycosylase SLT domain-containing protein [Anaerovoracaceae bacterium]
MNRKKTLIASALALALTLCSWTSAFADTPADLAPGTPADTASGSPSSLSSGQENEGATPDGRNEPEEPETAELPETADVAKKPEAPKESAKEKAARSKAEKYRNGLASYMRKINPKLGKVWSRQLAQIFIDAGAKYDLDPKVLMALAQRESGFNAKASSPYGYKGMMQTSDGLARKYGYKPSSLYQAEVSIDVASRYLGGMKKEFGTYTKALSGYVYGGYSVKTGCYSSAAARDILQTRREIKAYLEKYDFI